MVCEYQSEGKTVAAALTDPAGQLKAFMASRFPKWNAHEKLCDDGAYVGFVLREPDGHVVTNFAVTGKSGEPFLNLSHFQMLNGSQEDVAEAHRLIEDDDRVTLFDEAEPDKRTCFADRVVQNLVSKHIGGDPVMTVSHRDQLDHNQTYHIHRLLRVEA